MKILLLSGLVLTALAMPLPALAQSDKDREEVRQVVLDYVEAMYNTDPARMERSIHADLAKQGFSIRPGTTGYTGSRITFTQLIEAAKMYNKSGRVPKDAPKEVTIYDILDQTASVKLVAIWGIDYMHLAKYDGKWKIINVLWQSHPPKRTP